MGCIGQVGRRLQRPPGRDRGRVMDTPLAESVIVGTAIGLALRGYRPVCGIQFDGFVYPAFDQVVSQLAKMRDEAPRRDCSCGQDPARGRGSGDDHDHRHRGLGGVDAGTPVLTPGESAILAFGAVRDLPWVVNGDVVPRKVAHLAMSFDHRLVDGELGSRVLAEVGRLLNAPADAFLR